MGLDFVLFFFFFEWEGRASVLSPFYRLGKLRHRKMKWLAQDHPKSQQEVKRSLLRSSPGFWDLLSPGNKFDSLSPPPRLSAKLRTSHRPTCRPQHQQTTSENLQWTCLFPTWRYMNLYACLLGSTWRSQIPEYHPEGHKFWTGLPPPTKTLGGAEEHSHTTTWSHATCTVHEPTATVHR